MKERFKNNYRKLKNLDCHASCETCNYFIVNNLNNDNARNESNIKVYYVSSLNYSLLTTWDENYSCCDNSRTKFYFNSKATDNYSVNDDKLYSSYETF